MRWITLKHIWLLQPIIFFLGFKVIKFFKIIIQKLGEKIQRGKIIFETNATTLKANLNLRMNMYKYLGLIRVDNVLIWISTRNL